ncbi:Ankyrin repeat domain-containing protein 49, partial [Geodia barretti]
MAEGYDPDAFDSTAVVNAEEWNRSGPDGETLTRADILPDEVSRLSKEQLGEGFLKSAEHGATDVLRELHTLCGDDVVHTVDSDLYTPLHRASYNGHLESAEYLLSRGARVDSLTVDGWTPLHCACRWNKVAVADLLI